MRCVLACGGQAKGHLIWIQCIVFIVLWTTQSPSMETNHPSERMPSINPRLPTLPSLAGLSLFSSEHFVAPDQRVKKRRPPFSKITPSVDTSSPVQWNQHTKCKRLIKIYYVDRKFMGTENVKVVIHSISYYWVLTINQAGPTDEASWTVQFTYYNSAK